MKDIGILAVKRTPIGCFRGKLCEYSAEMLLSHTLPYAIQDLDLCIYGSMFTRGILPIKQSFQSAVQPFPANYTVSQGHNSGVLALVQASQYIRLGLSSVLTGGFDSASNTPHLLTGSRLQNQGSTVLLDSLIHQGYAFEGIHAGMSIEKTNAELMITRDEQDDYAYNSYKRRETAIHRNAFSEIEPVDDLKNDELLGKVGFLDSQAVPVHFKEGTVTMWNSAFPGDCAISLHVVDTLIYKTETKPLFKIVAYSKASVNHRDFPRAFDCAAKKLMQELGISSSAVDLWQVNDYFASIPIAFSRTMKIDLEHINVNGGSISLGDAFGASSNVHLVMLANALIERGLEFGVMVTGDISGNGIAIAISVKA